MRLEFLIKFLVVFVRLSLILTSIEAFAQWVELNNGINGGQSTCISSRNGNLLLGTPGGIYYSINNGSSWGTVNAGLDNTTVNAIIINNNNKAYVATNGGSNLFVSTPPYLSWSKMNDGLPSNSLVSLTQIGNQLFGLTNHGIIYTLGDNSTAWKMVNPGVGIIRTMTASGSNLFIASAEGVFFSPDTGSTWTPIKLNAIEKTIISLASFGTSLIATSSIGVVFFSKDSGANWFLTTLETSNYRLFESNGFLLAGNSSRVYFSTNQGVNWDQVRLLPGATDFSLNGSTLFASNRFGIYKSANNGQSWALSNTSNLTNAYVYGFSSSPNKLFCVTGVGAYNSENIGKSWNSITNGLPLDRITAVKYFDSRLFVAVSNYGVYQSDNDGSTWNLSLGIPRIFCFNEHGSTLFAGGLDGIYASNDKGANWKILPGTVNQVRSLAVRSDTLFACSYSSGISFSANKGQSWNFINEGLPLAPAYPISIFTHLGSLYVGTENGGGIYEQKKINQPWKRKVDGITNINSNTSFSADEYNFFAGGNAGIYLSNIIEANWSPFFIKDLPLLSTPNGIETLHIHKNHLFAGTTANGVWGSCIEPPRPIISVIGNAKYDSTLTSSSPNGNQWFLDGELLTDANESTLKPITSGLYSVKVTLNGCESKSSEARLFTLENYPDAIIEMPNVFTPNGDQLNALFIPSLYENVNSAIIQIIDRWGNLLYRSNDVAQGWDAQNTNAGIYYYRIQYVGLNGKEGETKGWVHVIR